jgi:hypothetical protein
MCEYIDIMRKTGKQKKYEIFLSYIYIMYE